MVSHDMEAMAKYAGYVLHLSHRQLFFGTKEEYMNTKEGLIFTSGEGAGNNAGDN